MPSSNDRVNDAPHVDPDGGHPSHDDVCEHYRYDSIGAGDTHPHRLRPANRPPTGPEGRDTSGPRHG